MEMPRELQEKLLEKLHEEAEKALKESLAKIEEKHLTFTRLIEERGEALVREFKEKVSG